MTKKLLFRAPVTTASGYGVHSRQILKSLLDCGEFDVGVIPTSWGQTPTLQDEKLNELVNQLVSNHIENVRSNTNYDVSVQCTIPNEFQKLARVNIGVTAGIEVDRVSPEWIIKTNENVDLIIVPSKHSAETFANVRYKTQSGELLQLQKPMMIAPEGVDSSIFNTKMIEPFQISLDTSFNFLSVGLGFDNQIGCDRKNLSLLVKLFCEKFKDDKDVGLVLKTSMVGYSLVDYNIVKAKIADIKRSTGCGKYPKIYLVHGRLSDDEMASLYKHPLIKAFVTLTHGEGYGLPVIEAAACGLPVIATNWSGHLDFLTIDGKKKFVPLDFDLIDIPKSVVWKNVMDEGTRWANVKVDDVKNKMKKVVLSYDKPKEWANELAIHVEKNFNLEKTCADLSRSILDFLSMNSNNSSSETFALKMKSQLGYDNEKTLLYTMPMSSGDVYVSTAVIDSLKKKFPDHKIIFATDAKYSSILKDNKNIDRIIQFENWMANVPLCEQVFDLVFTPNLAIQTIQSNWIKGGKGRLLAEEMAFQCGVTLGDYFIKTEKPQASLPERYIVLHPGSGKGQWEARNYLHWQNVVFNLNKMLNIPIVQVGLKEDPQYEGCIDYRGKTSSQNELAYVIEHANLVLGIDSVSMHLAAGLGIPLVSLFGSSYPTSTGPAHAKTVTHLLETPDRLGCKKACYKYQCEKNKECPCINKIDPRTVLTYVIHVLANSSMPELLGKSIEYNEFMPKIAGYTHVFNAESQGFPYIESIKSMLGFCDEVVVVDGGSNDGTVEKIKEICDERVKVFVHEWDWNEPGMDGMQKAFGRAMCSVGPNDFLWQQDADEVVHEDDYEKIKEIVKQFPRDADLIHLPVVELWGNGNSVRTDRHSWKWRLSRNNFRITHGINVKARVFDEKTGKTFAKKDMSDGCEYIDIMSGEYIPHKGFYNNDLERSRKMNPAEYGKKMNDVISKLPCVWHYSWAKMERKIKNFNEFWDKCWSNLYNEEKSKKRFDCKTDEEVKATAQKMIEQGGEHEKGTLFEVTKAHPNIMLDWRAKP